MTHQQAAVYLERATHLRTLAAALEDTPSMHLDHLCGSDTWFGPRADACRRALGAAQRAVRGAVDDLRATAWRFERTAEQLHLAALTVDREPGV